MFHCFGPLPCISYTAGDWQSAYGNALVFFAHVVVYQWLVKRALSQFHPSFLRINWFLMPVVNHKKFSRREMLDPMFHCFTIQYFDHNTTVKVMVLLLFQQI